jgi:hypothetical protein
MRISFRRLEHIVGFTIACVALVLYIVTLCPTVSFIDSGELAADVYTLGIPHPTGYPLFTIIGYLVAHLPLGLRVIYQLNLMAACLCAAGVYVFFRFMLFFINDLVLRDGKDRTRDNETVTRQIVVKKFVPATFGTLVLAFSETYWSQALSIEVYSLHVLFLAILLYLFTKAVHTNLLSEKEKLELKRRDFYWFSFAFVLGLSFTNHGTTILLAPAFLAAYVYVFGITSSNSWKNLLKLGIPFLLGLSVLIYLPVRASADPVMNWGDPDTFEKLLWHIRGRQYTVWLFESWENASKQLSYFFNTLPGKFAYVPLVPAALGAWKLFKTNRPVFVFTALLFIGCVGYAINYEIHDIDSYFLLAYVAVSLWCAVGASAIVSLSTEVRTMVLFSCGLILSTAVLPITNFRNVDESKSYLVQDYTADVFRSLQPQAIVISYQWDYFVSASFYDQLVENKRTDVIVIDKELLRRSWYLHHLELRYPLLIQQSKPELEAYTKELYKFEHNLPYNANVIEYCYANFIQSIIEKNHNARPIYVTQEIEPQYTGSFTRVPSGLAFQLFSDSSYHELPTPEFELRFPLNRDQYVDGIISLYARAFYNQAVYAATYGKSGEALSFISQALEIKPDFTEALMLQRRLQRQ